MNIDSIQDDFENQPHAWTADEPRPWEKTERAALYSFSVAVGSLVSAAVLKRKRTVSSPTVGIVLPPAPVEIAAAVPISEYESPPQSQVQQAAAAELPQQLEAPQAAAVELPQHLEVEEAAAAQSPSTTPSPASPNNPPPSAASSTASPGTPKSSETPNAVSPQSQEASAASSAASAAAAPRPQHPPPKEKAPRCSEEDEARIKEIFTTVANTSAIMLIKHKKRLESLGAELRKNKVHPFEILRCMPPGSMRKIVEDAKGIKGTLSGNAAKAEDTIKGIQEGMEREISNLERYAPGLAEDMGKSEQKVIPLIRKRKWRDLICYLFDIDGARK